MNCKLKRNIAKTRLELTTANLNIDIVLLNITLINLSLTEP